MSFSTDDVSAGGSNEQNEELEEFLVLEQQKAQLRADVQALTDACWEKCASDKPQPKLDTKMEACFENCVSRFVDVTLLLTNRFAQILQKTIQSIE